MVTDPLNGPPPRQVNDADAAQETPLSWAMTWHPPASSVDAHAWDMAYAAAAAAAAAAVNSAANPLANYTAQQLQHLEVRRGEVDC